MRPTTMKGIGAGTSHGPDRTDAAIIATLLGLNLLALILMAALDLRFGIPMRVIVDDPNAQFGAPPYVGAYSHVGVLLWTAGAAVALFGAACAASGEPGARLRPLLACGSAYMTLATLDDLFLLHETSKALPGVTWQVPMLLHGVLFMGVLALGWRVRSRVRWPLLLAAAVALVISAALDSLEALGLTVRGGALLEEGAKLSGISLLAAFMVATAHAALSPVR